MAQPGQSQQERLPAELDVHYADVDERSEASLLEYVKRLAKTVRYVTAEDKAVADGWLPLFNQTVTSGDTAAPRALFEAFLRLYRYPRTAINRLTGKHLDFFYRRVLRFEPLPATPDRAHVVLGLKKGSAPVQITPSHLFDAGKDAAGAEVLYSPTAETIVNTAKIASLRSIYVDHADRGRILFAPVANSADGLGGALPEDAPAWRPFGYASLPEAEIGFALASSILRLQEGSRVITLSLAIRHDASLTPTMVEGAFQAYLTGEKQWLGPYEAQATLSAGRLQLRIDLSDSEPAVVDYNPAVHFHAYTTDAPVVQLIFKPGASIGYDDLRSVTVASARISVAAEGVTSLKLESDAGTLDPKKAFLPFGPQPVAGARFLVGYDEALGKTLSRLDLTLQWKGVPKNLFVQYKNYSADFRVRNSAFTVSSAFSDRASTHTRSGERLFESDATEPAVLNLIGAAPAASKRDAKGEYVYALNRTGTTWAKKKARQMVMKRKVSESFLASPPQAQRGIVTITLDRSFLHAEYRQQSVAKIIEKATKPDENVRLLNEPHTPTVQSISLAYAAQTADVSISSTDADDFAQLDVQFFHVGAFGQMREHGHQRAAIGIASSTEVPLLPGHDGDGELLIGVEGLRAGDSLSVLFQVDEGSADPDVSSPRPDWYVLSNNYWKKLGMTEVVRDTTNRLLASGVISFVMPADATTDNTIMPPGPIWLKAAIAQDPASTSQLVAVVANAVELQFVMTSDEAAAAHLAVSHAKGTIAKLKTPVASVAKVSQPYPTFGGTPRESDLALRTRAAERLRHRNRAVTAWDYERLVLAAFPAVQRVKCIPHAKRGSWMAPGHVLVVVVPASRTTNVPDRLQPKVDADTIARITEYLTAHASASAQIVVRNPTYQQVHTRFDVTFHAGYEFNFYSLRLQQALMEFLSPWAFGAGSAISFGGRVYRSVLLDFVEELPYVDYVTDFRLSSFVGPATSGPEVDHVEAAAPDAVLVSAASHAIGEAT